jgi:hypothetical protein
VVESFLAIVISIISIKDSEFTVPALQTLKKFLKHDSSVYAMFKPNKLLLKKMGTEDHIVSSDP